MKLKLKLFFKSFLLSFVVFALLSGIIIGNMYMDLNSVEPSSKESTVLLGLTHQDKVICLTVVNMAPEKNSITFLPIPDNTLLNNNALLQELYDPSKTDSIVNAIEGLIGTNINRHIFFSADAVATLVNNVGTFKFLIPSPFNYNGSVHGGTCNMNGELAKAMFTYEDYDKKEFSYSEMGKSFLINFLSEQVNSKNANKITNTFSDKSFSTLINTDISVSEMNEYVDYLSDYSSLSHKSAELKGIYQTTSKSKYFMPDEINTDKNIFK